MGGYMRIPTDSCRSLTSPIVAAAKRRPHRSELTHCFSNHFFTYASTHMCPRTEIYIFNIYVFEHASNIQLTFYMCKS